MNRVSGRLSHLYGTKPHLGLLRELVTRVGAVEDWRMLVARQTQALRAVSILPEFKGILNTSNSLFTNITNTVTAKTLEPDHSSDDSTLNNAARAFFHNTGAMAGLFSAAGLLVIAGVAICFGGRMKKDAIYKGGRERHPPMGQSLNFADTILSLLQSY